MKISKHKVKQEITNILKGIDSCECDDNHGWWETSTGEEFGKRKLNEVLNFIDKIYHENNKT